MSFNFNNNSPNASADYIPVPSPNDSGTITSSTGNSSGGHSINNLPVHDPTNVQQNSTENSMTSNLFSSSLHYIPPHHPVSANIIYDEDGDEIVIPTLVTTSTTPTKDVQLVKTTNVISSPPPVVHEKVVKIPPTIKDDDGDEIAIPSTVVAPPAEVDQVQSMDKKEVDKLLPTSTSPQPIITPPIVEDSDEDEITMPTFIPHVVKPNHNTQVLADKTKVIVDGDEEKQKTTVVPLSSPIEITTKPTLNQPPTLDDDSSDEERVNTSHLLFRVEEPIVAPKPYQQTLGGMLFALQSQKPSIPIPKQHTLSTAMGEGAKVISNNVQQQEPTSSVVGPTAGKDDDNSLFDEDGDEICVPQPAVNKTSNITSQQQKDGITTTSSTVDNQPTISTPKKIVEKKSVFGSFMQQKGQQQQKYAQTPGPMKMKFNSTFVNKFQTNNNNNNNNNSNNNNNNNNETQNGILSPPLPPKPSFGLRDNVVKEEDNDDLVFDDDGDEIVVPKQQKQTSSSSFGVELQPVVSSPRAFNKQSAASTAILGTIAEDQPICDHVNNNNNNNKQNLKPAMHSFAQTPGPSSFRDKWATFGFGKRSPQPDVQYRRDHHLIKEEEDEADAALYWKGLDENPQTPEPKSKQQTTTGNINKNNIENINNNNITPQLLHLKPAQPLTHLRPTQDEVPSPSILLRSGRALQSGLIVTEKGNDDDDVLDDLPQPNLQQQSTTASRPFQNNIQLVGNDEATEGGDFDIAAWNAEGQDVVIIDTPMGSGNSFNFNNHVTLTNMPATPNMSSMSWHQRLRTAAMSFHTPGSDAHLTEEEREARRLEKERIRQEEEARRLAEEEEAAKTFLPIEEMPLERLEELEIQDIDRFTPQNKMDPIFWRIALCLLCVLFVWVTSALVLRAMANYAIPAPLWSQVVDRWEQVASATKSEMKMTKSCADLEFLKCNNTIPNGLDEFYIAMQPTVAQYTDAIAISNQRYKPCQRKFHTIISAFQTHHTVNSPILLDEERCNSTQLNRIRELFGMDTPPQIIQRLQIEMEVARNTWLKNYQTFVDSVEARYKYDVAYLKQLKAAVLQLDLDFTDFSNVILSAIRQLNSMLDIDYIFNTINFLPMVEPLTASIDPLKEEIEDIMGRLASFFKEVEKVSYMVGKLPSLGEIIPKSWSDKARELGELQYILLDAVQAPARRIVSEVQTHLAVAEHAVFEFKEEMMLLIRAVSDLQAISWDDIKFNIEGELPDLLDFEFGKVDAFINQLLNSGTKAKSSVKSVLKKVVGNLSPQKIIDLILPEIDFQPWELLTHRLNFDPIIQTLEQIITVLGVFDIIYRVISTCQLIFFYAKTTQSQLPTLDFRSNGDQNVIIDFFAKLPYGMLGPALTVVTFAVFFVALLLFIFFTYLTAYGSYVENCVYSDDGSSIASNANTIAFNFANDATRFYKAKKQQSYITTAWGICDKEKRSFQDRLDAWSIELTLDPKLYMEHYRDLSWIDQCVIKNGTFTNINPRNITTGEIQVGQYLQAFSTLSQNGPYPDINIPEGEEDETSTSTDDNNNQEEEEIEVETRLVNSQYIYNALIETCDPSVERLYPWDGFQNDLWAHKYVEQTCHEFVKPNCDGIDTCIISDNVLKIATRNASCDTEWLLHGNFMRIFMLIAMMACLNGSRVFLLKFFTVFFFDKLGNTNVEIVENYRYIEFKSTITDGQRKKGVKDALDSHRMRALIWLGVALICNVPWLTMMFMLNKNMIPKRVGIS